MIIGRRYGEEGWHDISEVDARYALGFALGTLNQAVTKAMVEIAQGHTITTDRAQFRKKEEETRIKVINEDGVFYINPLKPEDCEGLDLD